MNLLSKLETRFQELTFICLLLGTPLLMIGSLMHLLLEPELLTVWLGSGGSSFFNFLFKTIGLSSFLVPIFFAQYLTSIIKRFEAFPQALRNYDFHILKICGYGFLATITAVLLGVIESYYKLNDQMIAGLGGEVGRSLGFALFELMGIYGSLSAISLFVLVVAVLGSWIDLVGICLTSVAGVKKFFSAIWGDFAKKAEKNINDTRSEFAEENMHLENTFSGVIQQQRAVNAPVEQDLSVEQTAPQRKLTAVESTQDVDAEVKSRKPRKPKAKASDIMDVASANAEASTSPSVEAEEDKEYHIDLKAFTKRYIPPSKTLVSKQAKFKVPSKKELAEKSKVIEERLSSFGVNGKVTAVHPGIRLTMFEFLPDSGIKLNKISGLGSDLALLLGAPSIRILAPIPGKTTVGIEVPNKDTSILSFASSLSELTDAKKKFNLPVVIGQDVANKMHIADLSAMPHMLVAGTTGSGKSVFVNTLISSLLYNMSPKDLRMIMVDPKMIELTPYNEIPHLAVPVISDVVEAKDALIWAEKEMDRRYKIFSDMGARNLESFNEKIKKISKKRVEAKIGHKIDWKWEHMPYLVVVIDELADLMITQGKEVEIPITRIAQKARAAGIHLVLCTQRPSADIVTGLIKTNFPSRVSFKVSSNIDSRTILDQSGAEKLLGNGDMLYLPNGKSIQRLQGAFLSESDVNSIVAAIKD